MNLLLKILLTIALPFIIIWEFIQAISIGIYDGTWYAISCSKSDIKSYIRAMKG